MGRKVISGHGRFNENHLETLRRKKLPTFTIPSGVTLTVYAPAGAALDNAVANRIEENSPLSASILEIKMIDGARTDSIPDSSNYPYIFSAGDEMINYTVTPPDGLATKGSPHTVSTATSLKKIVDTISSSGDKDIHYACCGSGYSDNFESLFPYRGWYVRFKTK